MNVLGFVTDVKIGLDCYLIVEPISTKKYTPAVELQVDFDTAYTYKCLVTSKSDPIVEFNADTLDLIPNVEESIWCVPKDLVDASIID
ncbi:hypothetical protein [Heyndrickxia ginsengihumi]|uniref:hypothetical protein n=1 Tax=Heyndrickxia ginsengihumi TaxID=363870 RepID=UPI00046F4A41|nr:hypothetical protein [Heyndrickxia ginsengihumi]